MKVEEIITDRIIKKLEEGTVDNSAAYIQSWLNRLKNDKKLVIVAAGQAQKASDYILGKKYSEVA